MKRVISIVFVILLAAILIANRSEAVFGADSSGYANLARMLDRGETTLPLEAEWLTPLGFVPRGDRMASFYPIGLPIHLGLFARIGGWAHAPFLVVPLAGVVLVLLTFWLGTAPALRARGTRRRAADGLLRGVRVSGRAADERRARGDVVRSRDRGGGGGEGRRAIGSTSSRDFVSGWRCSCGRRQC